MAAALCAALLASCGSADVRQQAVGQYDYTMTYYWSDGDESHAPTDAQPSVGQAQVSTAGDNALTVQADEDGQFILSKVRPVDEGFAADIIGDFKVDGVPFRGFKGVEFGKTGAVTESYDAAYWSKEGRLVFYLHAPVSSVVDVSDEEAAQGIAAKLGRESYSDFATDPLYVVKVELRKRK